METSLAILRQTRADLTKRAESLAATAGQTEKYKSLSEESAERTAHSDSSPTANSYSAGISNSSRPRGDSRQPGQIGARPAP